MATDTLYRPANLAQGIDLLESYSYSTGPIEMTVVGGTANGTIQMDNFDFYTNNVVITARDADGADVEATALRESFTINITTNQKRKFQDNNDPELYGFVERFRTFPNLGLPTRGNDQLSITITGSAALAGSTLVYPLTFQMDMYGYELTAPSKP